MTREERDQTHYDTFARQQARKDILPASSIARRSQLFSALGPILTQSSSLGTVVEIGCGVGAPAKYLQGHYDRYIGLDHSTNMIGAAVSFNAGNSQAIFIAANAKTVPLPPHTADLILSIGALHHMSELDVVIQALTRLAKPGAWLVVREPQRANPLIQGLRRLRTRLDGSYSEEQIFFARQELVDLFQRNKLCELSDEYQGYFTPPFAQVVLSPQTLTMHLSRLADKMDNWLHEQLPSPINQLSFNLVMRAKFPG
jgi:SAM-dependent methyltransferase